MNLISVVCSLSYIMLFVVGTVLGIVGMGFSYWIFIIVR